MKKGSEISKRNDGFISFNTLLFFFGVILFFFVSIYTIRQLSNSRITVEVSGFELDRNKVYSIRGFINDTLFTEQKPDNVVDIFLADKNIPYVTTIFYENNGWFIRTSSNIFTSQKAVLKNLLLPKAELESKEVSSGQTLSLTQLDQDKPLSITNRSSSSSDLKIWFKKIENKEFLKLSSIQSSPVKISKKNDRDTIKIIDKSSYSVSFNDPRVVLSLPTKGNASEQGAILEIHKKGINNYAVTQLNGNEKPSFEVDSHKNYFIWNGWVVEFKGIIGGMRIVVTIFILLLLLLIFFILIRFLNSNDENVVRLIEGRVVRIGIVYLLFTVLSVILINHQVISGLFTRNWFFLYASLMIGWLIFFILAYKAKRFNFFENWPFVNFFTFLISERKKINTRQKYLFKNNYYVKLLVIPSIFLIFSYFFHSNERITIPFISKDYGIPVAHFSKIMVGYIIFVTRKKLFNGDLLTHIFTWSFVLSISIITSDFGSLLLTIISYSIASIVFKERLVIPNFINIAAWYKYYNYKGEKTAASKLLMPRKMILIFIAGFSALLFIIIKNGYKLSESFQSKLYRFALPYTRPDTPSFDMLSNTHKESSAKMFWELDNIYNIGFKGSWLDVKISNFFTTWHTDLAFLSYLKIGGYLFALIIGVLIMYILYDFYFINATLQKLMSNKTLNKLNELTTTNNVQTENIEKARAFLQEHIFIFFIVNYLVVQTIYPIFSNFLIVPLTGQPVPCLSVSIIEYLLTPLMLAYLYYTVGRIVHYNDSFFREPISEEIKKYKKFWLKIILPEPVLHGRFFVILVMGLSILFIYAKRQFLDKGISQPDWYRLSYIHPKGDILTSLLNRANNISLANPDDSPATSLLKAGSYYIYDGGTSSINKRREILLQLHHYIFEKAYKQQTGDRSVIKYENGFSIRRDENLIRDIYKSEVLANTSYKNYFDQKIIYSVGDPSLNPNVRIGVHNEKLIITSPNLARGLNSTWFSNATDSLNTGNVIFESGIIGGIKIINGQRRKILKFPEALGEFDLRSNTVDVDIQALTNSYLKIYLENLINNNRSANYRFDAGAIMIAENKTGFIRVMASYPNLANDFGNTKINLYNFLKDSARVISYLDLTGPFNICMVDAMPGSTIKPITATGVLATRPAIGDKNFEQAIAHSNPDYAYHLLQSFYKDTAFQRNMERIFGINVFQSIKYGVSPAYSNYPVSKTTYFGSHTKTSQNAIKSSAWGQGDVLMSLGSLVRNYIRIVTQKNANLTLYKKYQYDTMSVWNNNPATLQPLYNGMAGVISRGTATSSVGNALKMYKELKLSNFMGKTGTVQYSDYEQQQLHLANSDDNKVNYMILVTPSHTIAVSLFGDLQSENTKQHARGILAGLIPLLANWNNGFYLN